MIDQDHRWAARILEAFTADLSRLWIACDPDAVLLDETILSELRSRGFGVIAYDDPVAFRVEYEDQYRSAWDRGQAGPAQSLVLHLRSDDPEALPWDLYEQGRMVRMSLADLFPRLAYSVVRHVEAASLAALFEAHEEELASPRGEHESKDFILEHVYRLTPRSIRAPGDLWRELLRLHFSGRTLPPLLADHAAAIVHRKGLYPDQPLATWFASESAVLRVVQEAWYRYLWGLGVAGSRTSEPKAAFHAATEIPFEHPDVQVLVDSLFLSGRLHPLGAHVVPASIPPWARVGVVEDPQELLQLVLRGIGRLRTTLPSEAASHHQWSDFARDYGEVMARTYRLPGGLGAKAEAAWRDALHALQDDTDARLLAWIAAGRYSDLLLQPVAKGPVMVHHIPRFLRHHHAAGKEKVALVVFDGLAYDQWVLIREHLLASSQLFSFEEQTSFAWLPTVTPVSRQAIFSGKKPREFEGSIDRTDREEALWKAFWEEEGLGHRDILYRKALRHVDQLSTLQADLQQRQPKSVGLVVDEVDDRLHKERSKGDVALWISKWMETGFAERLFSMLLSMGYAVYLTADHGNVECTGVGRPSQGVIAETRGERVRVYRSEQMRDDSAASYPTTAKLEPTGLPANFWPLIAAGRTAFVPSGEQVVAHGGASLEEVIVPFVKISSTL